MKNILIVEDESLIALEISNFIEELGYKTVAIVSNGLDAIKTVDKEKVGLILMDVRIKGNMDGITCAQEIKKDKNIPLIYISAFSDDETLERAIQTNPTTYLTKPFNRAELQVALRIALKRNRRESDRSNLLVGDIILDETFSYHTLMEELLCCEEVVHLTKQEKQFLLLLLESKNQTVSFYEMENRLWPDKESNENTRRALVSRVRSKLNYKFLETIHSVGYRLNL